MLTENEAQDLMIKLIDLRKKSTDTNDSKIKLELMKHEQVCIEKFKYLITMRTSRYKSFNNYEDLNQEGMVALVVAMSNYNPKKGSFFWWAHKYIDTKIARSANLHTTIRYPLKVAKKITPHKETVMPLLVDEKFPDRELEKSQITNVITGLLSSYNDVQKQIVISAFGLDGDKPLSVNKICNKLNISRSTCNKELRKILSEMKENIKL